MSTIAIHHGTHLRLALATSLLAIGGCYQGATDEGEALELVDIGDAEEDDDVEEEPTEAPTAIPAICGPTMHVSPVGDAHNIGWDSTCNDGSCDISCPDAHANSDWDSSDHQGIDVFAYYRAPLVAVTSGTIQRVGWAPGSSTSGIRVRLRDDCGWEYYYGHLDQAVVSEGQRVEAGQLLGYMGNTGTGGVHLHFNISPDGGYSNDIDPFDLLKMTSPTACGGQPPAPEPQPEPQPQPPAGECDSVLAPDEALYKNQAVSSCNGQYTLVMQDDGNVVLYDLTGTPLWHTYTHGTAAEALVMQSDGNFVLYDGVGNALWHTGTHGHPGAAMRVEEDGNVIVWEGWTALWKAR